MSVVVTGAFDMNTELDTEEKELYEYCQTCNNAVKEEVEKGFYAHTCTLELNDDDYIYNKKGYQVGCKCYEEGVEIDG